MPKSRKTEEPRGPFRACEAPGCEQHAEYRAPKSKGGMPEFRWFCLDHVREFNKKWDYFEGMDAGEIEAFMKDAVTGHRPTWYMGGNASGPVTTDRLRAAFDLFMANDNEWRKSQLPPLKPKDKKALVELELDHPASAEDIKRRYKKLVKALHPDVRPGDREAEERFKRVTEAYRVLKAGYIGEATGAH